MRSVVPRHANWSDLKYATKQISGKIVNHCGRKDPWPALAELLSSRYGATGIVGIGSPAAENYFHCCSHSGFLTEKFCETYWFPVIQDQLPLCDPEDCRYSPLVRVLLYLCSHKASTAAISIFLTAALATLVWIKPEAMCVVMDCYIRDAFVENDYTLSTQVGSAREFVLQIRSSYDLNFQSSVYNVKLKDCARRWPVTTSTQVGFRRPAHSL